jgi:YD repeat-containing protein
MKPRNPSHGAVVNLARLLAAFALLLVAFGARADHTSDCTSRYAKSGAVPGAKWCALDVASNTPGGPGGYSCLNDIDLIKQWCSGETDPHPEQSCPVADPVYPGSGAVTLTESDFVSGDDVPMVFTRTYRSTPLAKNIGAMGPVWFHSWQRNLGLANANSGSSSTILAYRENGEPVTFNWSSGVWRASGSPVLSLAQSGPGWTLTNQATATAETYSAQGVLLSESTRTGFLRTLNYDGSGLLTVITQHAAGTSANNDLTVRLEYDDKRRVSRLLDPVSGMTQYGYDNNSNLTSVTWPDGNVRRYAYDDARFKNAITGEIDETGTRIATWSYDAQGRASAVSHPDASRNVQVAYGNGATTLSYGKSNLTIHFSSTGGVLRPTGTSSTKGATKTVWESDGNLGSQTGIDGSSQEYTYDNAGRPTRLVVHSASGISVTSVRYADATTLRPSSMAQPGKVRAFVYDATGNVTGFSEFATSDPTGESAFDAKASGQQRTAGVAYDSSNRAVAALEYFNESKTADWLYFYDETGNLRLATDRVSGWTLGMMGRDAAHRATYLAGDNREALITYNARGRVTQFAYFEYPTTLNGGLHRTLTVKYSYSADGQIVSRTGTVAKNNGGSTFMGDATPISSDEIDQWLDNYESGINPVGPPANLHGLLKALQFVQEPGLEPVCIECAFVIPLRWANTGYNVFKDPIWAGIGRGGKTSAEAKQCAELPPQLTFEEMSVILREAARGEKNFGLGSATRADAEVLGEAWVGSGARQSKTNPNARISKDGLRQYRGPDEKPNSTQATSGVQANFESRQVPNGKFINNGHLDILP